MPRLCEGGGGRGNPRIWGAQREHSSLEPLQGGRAPSLQTSCPSRPQGPPMALLSLKPPCLSPDTRGVPEKPFFLPGSQSSARGAGASRPQGLRVYGRRGQCQHHSDSGTDKHSPWKWPTEVFPRSVAGSAPEGLGLGTIPCCPSNHLHTLTSRSTVAFSGHYGAPPGDFGHSVVFILNLPCHAQSKVPSFI